MLLPNFMCYSDGVDCKDSGLWSRVTLTIITTMAMMMLKVVAAIFGSLFSNTT